MASAAERKAAERKRLRKEGLRPIEVWAHPGDHTAVKRYVERLAKWRNAK